MTKNVEPTTEELIAAGEIIPQEPTNEELIAAGEMESSVEERVLILETRIAELQRLVFLMSGSLPSAVASEFPDEGELTVYVQPPANV